MDGRQQDDILTLGRMDILRGQNAGCQHATYTDWSYAYKLTPTNSESECDVCMNERSNAHSPTTQIYPTPMDLINKEG